MKSQIIIEISYREIKKLAPWICAHMVSFNLEKKIFITRNSSDASQIELESIRQLQLKDKRLFEMAQKAFPSFIMAYKNHECKYIFRERDLLRDIGKYATCFGLLKMPKLEELKHKKITDFEDSDFDIR